MARAIPSGRKTQTRRVLAPQPERLNSAQYLWKGELANVCGEAAEFWRCPYGQSGDVLGIREAAWMWCQKVRNGKTPKGRQKWKYVPFHPEEPKFIRYCADHPDKPIDRPCDSAFVDFCWRYKGARYLPRVAVRTRVQIASIRVERVQDISEEDSQAEGVECVPQLGVLRCSGWKDYSEQTAGFWEATESFRSLWDSINEARGFGWNVNPFVWVITFRRLESEVLA